MYTMILSRQNLLLMDNGVNIFDVRFEQYDRCSFKLYPDVCNPM